MAKILSSNDDEDDENDDNDEGENGDSKISKPAHSLLKSMADEIVIIDCTTKARMNAREVCQCVRAFMYL